MTDERQRILQLRKELHEHNYKYYVLNQPEISDQEFDFMMKELQELEARHEDMFDPNSPTQRWVATLIRSLRRLRINIQCCRWLTHTARRKWPTSITALRKGLMVKTLKYAVN